MNDFKFNYTSDNQKLMNVLMHLQIDSSDKQYTERSEDEYLMLKDIIFENKPKVILDLGSGIGRSSAYFNGMAELGDTKFYLADYNGQDFDKKKECGTHDNAKPIAYNDLSITESFCENNGMNMDNVKTINLDTDEINGIERANLVYSFHCIGYHWSIEEAFTKYNLSKNTSDDAMLVFGSRMTQEVEDYPEKIGDFKLFKAIPGKFLQRFLIYKKQK